MKKSNQPEIPTSLEFLPLSTDLVSKSEFVRSIAAVQAELHNLQVGLKALDSSLEILADAVDISTEIPDDPEI